MHEEKVDSLLTDAKIAAEKGDLSGAESLCLQALQLEKRPDVYAFLGLVFVNAGKTQQAIQTYQDLLAADPNNLEAPEWLVTLYVQEGRVKEAETIAASMKERRPNQVGGWSALGRCRYIQGDWKGAAEMYGTAVRLAPGIAGNHHFLGLALYRLGNKSQAEMALRKAIELMPRSHTTMVELGQLLIEKKEYAGAIALLQRAVQLAPSSPSLVLLAKAYNLSERFDEGMIALRQAIQINPRAQLAYEMMGDRLQDRGEFESAIKAFEAALAIDDSSAGAYYGITRCRKITAQDEGMIRRMNELISQPGRTEDELRHLNYALAKSNDDLGNYETAMSFYDEANRLAKLKRPVLAERAGAVKWGESKLFRTFDRAFFEDHAELGSPSEKPIFIVGMIRSGTTLTEQIVSSHRDVGGGGEIKFWMEDESVNVLRTAMAGHRLDFEVRKLIQRYDSILSRLGKDHPRVTDKMPINYIALGLMHLCYPNAKILHCRRSPIDTCLSIYMTPLGAGPGFAFDRRDIVDAYREYEMVMAHWRSVIPATSMMEVQYEELVDRSEEKIREIISFLGLEWDDACLSHDRNDRNVMTPSRWQARQPVYRTSVEKWRRYEPWLREFAELLQTASE